MAVPKERERYSYADCLTWDEKDRIEIIDGEAFMMSPPNLTHQRISRRLTSQIDAFLQGKECELFYAPFGVRLFEKDGDRPEDVDTLVEPDLSVICDKNKLDDAGCKGAPDFIIEIMSPSNRRHDKVTKLNLYQRAGVREYHRGLPAGRRLSETKRILRQGRSGKGYRPGGMPGGPEQSL